MVNNSSLRNGLRKGLRKLGRRPATLTIRKLIGYRLIGQQKGDWRGLEVGNR